MMAKPISRQGKLYSYSLLPQGAPEFESPTAVRPPAAAWQASALPEGPFGEFTCYYAADKRPCLIAAANSYMEDLR